MKQMNNLKTMKLKTYVLLLLLYNNNEEIDQLAKLASTSDKHSEQKGGLSHVSDYKPHFSKIYKQI